MSPSYTSPGKVVTELGRRNVYAITSAEKGKTHTILACVSASGYVLPTVMIYPRKQVIRVKKLVGLPPPALELLGRIL